MARRDGAEIRKMRMQEVAVAVTKSLTVSNKGFVFLSEILPELQYQTGLTKDKVTEYLVIIAATGRFDLDIEHDKIMKLPTQASPEQILEAARGVVQ